MSRPEPVEAVAHGCQSVRPDDEQVSRALAPLCDKGGTSKHPQVVGHDLLRHAQLLSDLAYGTGLVPYEPEDPTPGPVGQRAQRPVGRLRFNGHPLIQV